MVHESTTTTSTPLSIMLGVLALVSWGQEFHSVSVNDTLLFFCDNSRDVSMAIKSIMQYRYRGAMSDEKDDDKEGEQDADPAVEELAQGVDDVQIDDDMPASIRPRELRSI
eukprot:g28596.t1